MEPAKFGQLARRARVALKLTQSDVGRIAGVPQSHVARIEAGEDIRLSTASRIAGALRLRLVAEPDALRLFQDPPASSALAAARDFGVDMSLLYERAQMTPAQRLDIAASNSRGLDDLLR